MLPHTELHDCVLTGMHKNSHKHSHGSPSQRQFTQAAACWCR